MGSLTLVEGALFFSSVTLLGASVWTDTFDVNLFTSALIVTAIHFLLKATE